MASSVDNYIRLTVDAIEEHLDLGDASRKRLEEDLRSEVLDRFPETAESSVTLAKISELLGSPKDWATDFVENADFPPARLSRNYINCMSDRTLFGLPLVHIACGTKNDTPQVAKGIIAVGDTAIGLFAMGRWAIGLFSIGGFSLGLFSIGGFSLGLLFSLGGFSAGALAVGGFALGFLAWGGCAIGYYAIGGCAIGHTLVGGFVYGFEGVGGVEYVRETLDKSHWLRKLNLFLTARLGWIIPAIVCVSWIVPALVSLLTVCWVKKKTWNASQQHVGKRRIP